jgi:hypothetical protein
MEKQHGLLEKQKRDDCTQEICGFYCIWQVMLCGTIGNREDAQTNIRKKEKLAGTSTEEAIRNNSQKLSYYQPIGR